jgi:hypothetical protein
MEPTRLPTMSRKRCMKDCLQEIADLGSAYGNIRFRKSIELALSRTRRTELKYDDSLSSLEIRLLRGTLKH